MQDCKGMEQGEGHYFYPKKRHHGNRLMMGAMGQVPVLGQLAKGVVLYPPAKMANVPDNLPAEGVQVARDHPDPVLFLLNLLPLIPLACMFRPLLNRAHRADRSRVGVAEPQRPHIPDLDLSSIPLDHPGLLIPPQGHRLLINFKALLLQDRDNRPPQFFNHGLEERAVGIPGIHHHHIKET